MSERARVGVAIGLVIVGWAVSAVGTPGETHGLVPLGMILAAGGAAFGLRSVGWYERLPLKVKLLTLFGVAVIAPVVADAALR